MNSLSHKERFLILIVVNLLLYYAVYTIAVKPLSFKGMDLKAEVGVLEETRDANREIISSKDKYKSSITTLTDEKENLFKNSFPNAETENIYTYMVNSAKANTLQINSVNVSQVAQTIKNEETGGEIETGLNNTTISAQFAGSYANSIKFIQSIEEQNKTSILTSLSMRPGEGGMSIDVGYTFLTVDKGENSKDTIFDYTFGQAKGDSTLFN